MSADEVEAIVALAKRQYVLMKDVAQQYRVQSNLVGRLLKESNE